MIEEEVHLRECNEVEEYRREWIEENVTKGSRRHSEKKSIRTTFDSS